MTQIQAGDGEGAPRGRPRVAVVIPKYGLIGGGERFARELTERLARTGKYEFHVFANRWNSGRPEIAFHKVPMLRFPRSLRPLGFAWFAERMVAKGNFDLVHAHERIFRADVFSVHSVPHAGWVRDVRRKRPSLFDRATIRVEKTMMAGERSVFLPVSTMAGEAFAREYAVDPARIRVVHPGVDIERFSVPDRGSCRREIRLRYGIGPSEIVVLFVGMNFEVKGLDGIMASLAGARRSHPGKSIRLLVVGKGNVGEYGSIARKLGLGDSVVFAGPQPEGVERFYLASDIFMMLSRYDTFGMAVLEAMAARLPVIISAGVGAKDLVEDGGNGFIVGNACDADSVAERIGLLLEEDLRARMGEAAFRTAGRHSWDAIAAEVEGIYEETIARGRNR
ncbi:MAG TPA: glycosyltransferase family 4 protein [Candidatus Deferrimicrobiaceae bacterium]